MAAINSTIGLNDGMTPVFQQIYESMAPVMQMIGQMQDALGESMEPNAITETREQVEDLADAIEDIEDVVTPIEDLFEGLGEPLERIGEETRRNTEEQQEHNEQIGEGQRQARILDKILKGLTIAGFITMTRNFFNANVAISDQYNTLRAQIDFMNDGLQTTAELQDLIFASAKRTRATFLETADTIVRMQGSVGEMFADNRSLIQFVETFQQATIASGANARDMEVAMSALERAMADGALSGRDFDFIMQRSSRTVQALADYLEVPMYQVRNLANEGEITADVLARAMFNAVDEINEEFNSMDDTWEDHMNNMKNSTLRAFEPLMESWSAFIQGGGGFEILMNTWINGIQLFAAALLGVFNVIAWVIEMIAPAVEWVSNLIMNNLDWIMVGLIVLAGYLIFLAYKWIVAGLAAETSAIKTAIAWAKAMWPVALIVAIVLTFIYLMDQLGFTVADVLGFVAGIFGALFAYLFNLFAYFWNIVASIAEFFVNVWNHPAYATQRLFFNLVSNVLNLFGSFADGAASAANTLGDVFVSGANIAIRAVNGLIGLMNKIPGIDIGTVGEVSSASVLNGAGDRIRGLASGLDPGATPEDFWEAPRMDMMDMGATAGAWNDWTRNAVGGITDRVNGLFDSGIDHLLGGMGDVAGLDQDFLDKLGNIDDGIGGVNERLGGGLGRGNEIGDIGRIRDDVEISKEDLKLLKDLAERNFILNYQQLSPELSITVHNNGEDVDIDELIERIEDMLEDQQASALVTT